jgi:hypothetical protein
MPKKANDPIVSARKAWLEQLAFLVVHCHLSIAEAKTVDDVTFNAFYKAWLDGVKLQERFTARICLVVNRAFGGSAKEDDFITVGKEDNEDYLSVAESIAMVSMCGNKQERKK